MQGDGERTDGSSAVSTPVVSGQYPVALLDGPNSLHESTAFSAGPEEGGAGEQEGQVASDDLPTVTTTFTDRARSSRAVNAAEVQGDQEPSTSQFGGRGSTSDVEQPQCRGCRLGDYRFIYARAGALTIGDVGDLLKEYKELVLRYVALSKAVEASRPSMSVVTQTTDTDLG